MTKEARIYNGEKTVSSISDAVKTGQLHVKNEIRRFSNTIYKNNLEKRSWKTLTLISKLTTKLQ